MSTCTNTGEHTECVHLCLSLQVYRSDTLLPPVDRAGLTPQAQTDPVTAAPYRPHGLLHQVFMFLFYLLLLNIVIWKQTLLLRQFAALPSL